MGSSSSRNREEKSNGGDGLSTQVHKLVLLGSAKSGKSTLFKRFNNIYGTGFSKEEVSEHALLMRRNALASMKFLVSQTESRLLLSSSNDNNGPSTTTTTGAVCSSPSFVYMKALPADRVVEEAGEHIKTLWNDAEIQRTYYHTPGINFQTKDSCVYSFDNVDRIFAIGYEPTEEDIVMCRTSTPQATKAKFQFPGIQFVVIDAGDDKEELNNILADTNSVVFVASLSEYDEISLDDNSTNCAVKAMSLYEEVLKLETVKNLPVALFLNKKDVFEEKIKRIPLSNYFPEYKGRDLGEILREKSYWKRPDLHLLHQLHR
eukprot:TRINITY_DN43431_c0_g1_i6.p1 TRINITY_DN43431_c0_g1~~TRINITY_DN43431_c0_g1_i6.p1  ORF type:complete len:318 (+),score=85.70 TRINITY_DN43431_c0_g1_i6:845-1798(+)